jgi:tetratricopeptide (TPR) repeat protein
VALALAIGGEPVQIERRKLANVVTELAGASSASAGEARALLRSAMLRHPGEPYFPLLGSFVARHERKDPLPWLARALERGPRSGKVHLALAEVLRARGAIPQALMHLRLAARYDFNSRERALSLAGTWARSSRELILAFPESSEGGKFLRDACGYQAGGAKLDCLREAVRRDAGDRAARGSLLELLLDAWEGSVEPCAAEGAGACSEEVGRLVAALKDANDWRAANARGRLVALRGDVRRAARDLLEQCPAATEAEPCVARALAYAERAGDIGLIERASERYLALACVVPARCADAQFRIGKILSGRGASRVALRHFKQAVEVDPSPRRWLDMADAAMQAGSSSTARLAIQRASSAGELTSDDQRRKAEIEERLSQPARLE